MSTSGNDNPLDGLCIDLVDPESPIRKFADRLVDETNLAAAIGIPKEYLRTPRPPADATEDERAQFDRDMAVFNDRVFGKGSQ